MEKGWLLILTSDRKSKVASDRSDQKNDVIFEFLDPKNLYFNIHHGKEIDLNFDL